MKGHTPYRTYWITWVILLVLTLTMIFIEAARIPAGITVLVLVVAMLAKATLIGGWFMHLRFEQKALVWAVVGGTLLTAAVLYFLLIPDGLAALRQAPQ